MKKQKVKNTQKTRSRAWILITILASAVILAVVVGSLVSSPTAEAQQESSRQPQAADDTTVEFANQKITIDAQTGRLRKPTVEEARAIVEAVTHLTDRSSEGLRVKKGPNGSRLVDLQGRFQSVVLAKPNPDGTNEVRCVTSLEEASDFLGLDPAKIPVKGIKEATNAK